MFFTFNTLKNYNFIITNVFNLSFFSNNNNLCRFSFKRVTTFMFTSSDKLFMLLDNNDQYNNLIYIQIQY